MFTSLLHTCPPAPCLAGRPCKQARHCSSRLAAVSAPEKKEADSRFVSVEQVRRHLLIVPLLPALWQC